MPEHSREEIDSILQSIEMRAPAAPTKGYHKRGTIVWNTAPSAGGYIGWTCVETGTPGTWKGFGVIQS